MAQRQIAFDPIMDPGVGFWLPFIVIFAAAIFLAVLQRRSRDVCMKHFEKCYVLIKLKDGKWIWGNLRVRAKSLVLDYPIARRDEDGWSDRSYVLYEQQLMNIFCILKPIPRKGTVAYAHWLQEMEMIRNPSRLSIARRSLRNFFNTVRDAFSQTVGMLVGLISQKTQLSKIGADQPATKVGQTLLNIVPNSYEPILEEYISSEVKVKILLDENKKVEWGGLLQEYSDKFLLIRDAQITERPPVEGLRSQDRTDRFGVLLPRDLAFVRHLGSRPRKEHPAAHEGTSSDAAIKEGATHEESAGHINDLPVFRRAENEHL